MHSEKFTFITKAEVEISKEYSHSTSLQVDRC